jgi:hypothetical protein
MAIHRSNNPNSHPIAKVDVARIVYEGLMEDASIDKILEELRSAGDRDETRESVAMHLEELCDLMNKLFEYWPKTEDRRN